MVGVEQTLLRRCWRACQANTVRENNAPEPIFPILGGIQVKDMVRMSSVATCWVKNSSPPVSLASYAPPPSILMLAIPLLPNHFLLIRTFCFLALPNFPTPNSSSSHFHLLSATIVPFLFLDS